MEREKMEEIKSSNPLNQDEIQIYLKDIRKLKVMTPEREKVLAERIISEDCSQREIDAIQKEMLEGNLRFVITVAKKYQNQGVDLSDLIAEGNFGLMKAIKNFDWSKKNRFISYAVWWIKQSILQSLNDNSRTIRLPVNVVQDMQKEKRENEKTSKDLSDKFANLPRMIDLDMHINEDGDTLIDIIKNENVESPDEVFSTQDVLKEKMMGIMSVLDERERMIVEDYYGITGTPRTLEDIGSDFSLTKERVRQIKEKALRKLRNECSDLFEYM
jgi:RNA polymerase primary sigma factor